MTTIFFIVSLLVICFMIASKIFELEMRRNHFLSNLFSKGDVRIHQFIEKMILAYNHYKKIAQLFVFDFLPSYAYELLVHLKDYVAKKYYLWGDDFRGRRMLRDRGSVSAFLQHITENKGDVPKREA